MFAPSLLYDLGDFQPADLSLDNAGAKKSTSVVVQVADRLQRKMQAVDLITLQSLTMALPQAESPHRGTKG